MMQHLIQVLKHGYGYDHTKEDGTVERTLVAPNKYMISAAKEIEQLIYQLEALTQALETERFYNLTLHNDCNAYRKTIAELESREIPNPSYPFT